MPVIGVKPGLILTFRQEATLAVTDKGVQPDLVPRRDKSRRC